MANVVEVTARLWDAREAADYCPAWLPGALTFDEALAVQLALLERELARGRELGGWKVGFTSPRARKAVGTDTRPFGYVLAHRVFASGATVPAASIQRASIEPELCFTFRSRLAGEVSRAEVEAAVARVSAGYELNERRPGSARPDVHAMITDCVTQWGIVAGSGVALPPGADLGGVRCTLSCNGDERYSGLSRDELDDHMDSLAALAAELGRHGRAIEAGQRAITGAFARFEIEPGQRWRATYSGIGDVEVTFT
jgi:2-keto-4-pentenoate hydratase